MLTNYDMDSTTPLAVLLVGQPTLRKRMKHGVLAALDQRISISYQMSTMNKDETASYVKHHLTIRQLGPTVLRRRRRPDPPHQPRPVPLPRFPRRAPGRDVCVQRGFGERS